ncbi:hypothetical protein [Catenovulum sediminis]|uniref:Porin n=1 Tax=Catenovulum sediminis TaxID=1740262 RepID=A0ABV1RHQ2_9ALTE
MKVWKFVLFFLIFSSPILRAAEISVNGFASVRGGQILQDDAHQNPRLPDMYNDEYFTLTDESLFAIQGRVDLQHKLSATVQLVAHGSENFEPEVKWAYLSYQLNDNHALHVGRFANPIFHQSEYELVGYTHNFSRLPKSVYFGFDFSNVDGIKLQSNFLIEELYLDTHLSYSSWQGDIFNVSTAESYDSELNDIFNFSATLSGENWQLFGGYLSGGFASTEWDSQLIFPLIDGFNAASGSSLSEQEVQLIKAQLGADDNKGEYAYMGANIEWAKWIFNLEYVEYQLKDSFDSLNRGWFTAVGRRLGDFVVTYHHEVYLQSANGYPQANSMQSDAAKLITKQTIDILNQREMYMDVVSLRYDFHPSAAFKADIFVGNDKREQVGSFVGYSFGLDIVF